jgi:glutathione S-transferase
MLVVHARTLDPMSRALRVALGEKRALFSVIEVPAFASTAQLMALEPEGRTPVLVDDAWEHGAAVTESVAALEYLEDLFPTPPLLPGGPLERAAARGLSQRAMRAFAPLVEAAVREKVWKRAERAGAPDAGTLRRVGEEALALVQQAGEAALSDGWLAGRKLSLADIVAAAHISVLDFLDCISWGGSADGRDWYARVKHRPSFKPLLSDALPGFLPPVHYADLDF